MRCRDPQYQSPAQTPRQPPACEHTHTPKRNATREQINTQAGSPHLFGRISLKGYLRGELVHRSCLKADHEQRLSGPDPLEALIQNKGERDRERDRDKERERERVLDKQYESKLRQILFTLLLSPFLLDVSSENNTGERTIHRATTAF